MKTDNKYLKLFLTFFKIGACTFGGGYAMISVIQREAAEKNKWVTDDEIIDMLAISESTPGPIAINSATFVGYRVGGVFGSACATFGVVLPSLIIITLIAYFLRQFAEYKVVRYAFNGIRAGVVALVAKAFITMFKKCPKNVFSYTLLALSLVSVAFFDVSALIIIAAAAVIGVLFFVFTRKKEAKTK